MSEIEESLKGLRPCGMNFVKSQISAPSTCIFKVIKHIEELSPRKFVKFVTFLQPFCNIFHDITSFNWKKDRVEMSLFASNHFPEQWAKQLYVGEPMFL